MSSFVIGWGNEMWLDCLDVVSVSWIKANGNGSGASGIGGDNLGRVVAVVFVVDMTDLI